MKPMTRHTLIVFAALFAVIGCLLAADAEAGDFGPGRPFGEAELGALAQAEAYWGRQPDLCTSRSVEVVADGALSVAEEGGRPIAGRATMPEGKPRPCLMYLEEDEVVEPTNLCSVVRHEYGHWLGIDDPELVSLPDCEAETTEASGGLYAPPSPRVVAHKQAWELWREWQVGCYRMKEGSAGRAKCFRNLRRYAVRMHRKFG